MMRQSCAPARICQVAALATELFEAAHPVIEPESFLYVTPAEFVVIRLRPEQMGRLRAALTKAMKGL